MSIRASAWAWTVHCSPTAKLVLLALADHADEVGYCWPSVARLVEMTGLVERTVRTAIGTLTTSGLMRIDRAGNGRGHSSHYALSINLAPERVQEMPPSRRAERVQEMPERVHLLPERVQHLPERVQEMHPEPSITIKNRQEPKKRVAAVTEIALPAWLPAPAWTDWCDYRKGPKFTQRAAELSLAKLGTLRTEGHDPAEVINQSIASGWSGLFPLKRGAANAAPSKVQWMIDDMMGDRT